MDKKLEITFPMRLKSEANLREHWAIKARRTREQRRLTTIFLSLADKPSVPCECVLTRMSPRKLDSDNLARAFKAVRDAVAKWIGVDDGDEKKIKWTYRQEKNKSHCVNIFFREG